MGMLSDDHTCYSCYGTKVRVGSTEKCGRCCGTGRELTELGRELIRFLQEYFVLVPKTNG